MHSYKFLYFRPYQLPNYNLYPTLAHIASYVSLFGDLMVDNVAGLRKVGFHTYLEMLKFNIISRKMELLVHN